MSLKDYWLLIPNWNSVFQQQAGHQGEKKKMVRNTILLVLKNSEKKIDQDAFAEWEEVYPDKYYGTLRSEMERIWKKATISCLILM